MQNTPITGSRNLSFSDSTDLVGIASGAVNETAPTFPAHEGAFTEWYSQWLISITVTISAITQGYSTFAPYASGATYRMTDRSTGARDLS